MDIYSDDKNPKAKKVANKIINFTLNNKKSSKKKLKIKKSKIKHTLIVSKDSRRDKKPN
jgi:hypothetical protein